VLLHLDNFFTHHWLVTAAVDGTPLSWRYIIGCCCSLAVLRRVGRWSGGLLRARIASCQFFFVFDILIDDRR